jgi:hypothetical protein
MRWTDYGDAMSRHRWFLIAHEDRQPPQEGQTAFTRARNEERHEGEW